MSATAPTPSASVETPTSTVNSPQTIKRTPTKSTVDFTAGIRVRDWGSGRGRANRHAQLDADGRGVGRFQAEAHAGAVGDARRYRDAQRLMQQRLTRAQAERARLGPRFAAASA